jgi:hypothetical protein
MDDEHELERERQLPGFEQDDERTVGGGLMSEGGTATDRGTGDLGGDGLADDDREADDDEPVGGLANDLGPGGAIAPGPPAGGGAPYLAAYVDNDEDDAPDDQRND